jgi:signal transduction histidine kinase
MFKKICFAAVMSFLLAGSCYAQEKFTPQLAKEKVNAAVQLFSKEGKAAYPKFKDPNGEFRFAGGEGYIWIHSISGIMVMHPTKQSMEGMPQLDLNDSNSFYFIAAMNDLVQKHGEGWVFYLWPKPGQATESPKGSFVKLAMWDGRGYVVGCGKYDMTEDEVSEAFPKDIIWDKDTADKK